MTLRVYIAGASAERQRAERAIRFALAAGMSVTFDWPETHRAQPAPESLLPASQLRPILARCLDGVMQADAMWLLAPSSGVTTTGAWVELGYLLALRDHGMRVPLIVSLREVPLAPIFPQEVPGWLRCFADAMLDSDSDALAQLTRLSAPPTDSYESVVR